MRELSVKAPQSQICCHITQFGIALTSQSQLCVVNKSLLRPILQLANYALRMQHSALGYQKVALVLANAAFVVARVKSHPVMATTHLESGSAHQFWPSLPCSWPAAVARFTPASRHKGCAGGPRRREIARVWTTPHSKLQSCENCFLEPFYGDLTNASLIPTFHFPTHVFLFKWVFVLFHAKIMKAGFVWCGPDSVFKYNSF